MANIVIQVEPGTVVMTGLEFMTYANRYLEASELLIKSKKKTDPWFDPIPYQLVCQSLELHLKSFIWLRKKYTREKIKTKYGHDIEKLWHQAISEGLTKYCKPTDLRNKSIALVGPYYKSRKFTYLDLSMTFTGIKKLRSNPWVTGTLLRLCKRLQKSLHKSIISAA